MVLRYAETLHHPTDTAVSMPRLYYEDKGNRIMIMFDCGEKSQTLKALFQNTPPSVDVSQIIGRSLDIFLAYLHSSTPEIKRRNRQTREIVALISYGWIISTLSPKGEDFILIVSPIDLSPPDTANLNAHADDLTVQLASGDDVLSMGDFWPGNTLVSFTPDLEPCLMVVNWEVVGLGLGGIDLGQSLLEMHIVILSYNTIHRLTWLIWLGWWYPVSFLPRQECRVRYKQGRLFWKGWNTFHMYLLRTRRS